MNLINQYNKLITIHNKAAEYLDNNNIPLSQREKKIPEYKKIVDKLNELITEFDKHGIKYSSNEILNGFKVAA
jgi:hypothetical protein